MPFKLRYGKAFERRLQRLLRQRPDLSGRVAHLLRDLEAEPFPARLQVHTLGGQMQGLHAARLTGSYRVIFRMLEKEHVIDLLDIGTRDEAYP